jgi:4-hydroxythreonine-4-phosphate dehydrogenase
MEKDKIKVGITQGDLNGVGYEVILKAFANPLMMELCTPIVYGSPKAAAYHSKAMELETQFTIISDAVQASHNRLNILSCYDEEPKIELGQPSAEAGATALKSLEKALADYREGKIDVLVTAPINKKTIQSDDFHFPGHTEYIEAKVGDGQKALMVLMTADNAEGLQPLRVALVTTHKPIREVADAITQEAIVEKVHILNESLKRDFRISGPRIAVLALNPHAGDDGLIGTEEQTVIKPAIEALSAEGIGVFGPYAADGFFGSGAYMHFDATLAMYHDQGLAAFKALSMSQGINYTAGLPIVRTSPDHGTAYDLAGKGIADETSMRQAIYAAIDIYRNRKSYDAAHANPLRKLYKEHRDDSDKLKLDAPTDED